jgi:hypothetical protein
LGASEELSDRMVMLLVCDEDGEEFGLTAGEVPLLYSEAGRDIDYTIIIDTIPRAV